MNYSGILGLISGIILILYGIVGAEGGRLGFFYDPASIAITLGGTLATLLISFPFSTFKKVPRLIAMVFKPKKYKPREHIDQIVEYCQIARSKGLLALEDSANNCEDPFMKSALMLIVDATDGEKVREMLDDALDFMSERHESAINFFDRGAALAPGFGMIGTLIGLINMLGTMDDNPDGLAAGMSVALVTTFYGSVLANLIFAPIASRLKALHDEELLCMQIIEEGVLAIQSGANPRNVREKLEFMLPKDDDKKKKSKE